MSRVRRYSRQLSGGQTYEGIEDWLDEIRKTGIIKQSAESKSRQNDPDRIGKIDDTGIYSRENILRALKLRDSCGVDSALKPRSGIGMETVITDTVVYLLADSFFINAYLLWVGVDPLKVERVKSIAKNNIDMIFSEDRKVCNEESSKEMIQKLTMQAELAQSALQKAKDRLKELETAQTESTAEKQKLRDRIDTLKNSLLSTENEAQAHKSSLNVMKSSNDSVNNSLNNSLSSLNEKLALVSKEKNKFQESAASALAQLARERELLKLSEASVDTLKKELQRVKDSMTSVASEYQKRASKLQETVDSCSKELKIAVDSSNNLNKECDKKVQKLTSEMKASELTVKSYQERLQAIEAEVRSTQSACETATIQLKQSYELKLVQLEASLDSLRKKVRLCEEDLQSSKRLDQMEIKNSKLALVSAEKTIDMLGNEIKKLKKSRSVTANEVLDLLKNDPSSKGLGVHNWSMVDSLGLTPYAQFVGLTNAKNSEERIEQLVNYIQRLKESLLGLFPESLESEQPD